MAITDLTVITLTKYETILDTRCFGEAIWKFHLRCQCPPPPRLDRPALGNGRDAPGRANGNRGAAPGAAFEQGAATLIPPNEGSIALQGGRRAGMKLSITDRAAAVHGLATGNQRSQRAAMRKRAAVCCTIAGQMGEPRERPLRGDFSSCRPLG
jgi:hypothetical protein